VATLLLDSGARIEPKDVAGYSALFHCCTAYASRESLQIARLLLKRGADPNTHNRNLRTPLHEALMGARVDVADLLCNFGASPMLADADDLTPMKMSASARLMGGNTARVTEVFREWQRRQALMAPGAIVSLHQLPPAQSNFNTFTARCVRWDPWLRCMHVELLSEPGRTLEVPLKHLRLSTDREQEGEGIDCQHCAAPSCRKQADQQAGVTLKRCVRCLAVAYCSRDCQREHWPQHRPYCKSPAAAASDAASAPAGAAGAAGPDAASASAAAASSHAAPPGGVAPASFMSDVASFSLDGSSSPFAGMHTSTMSQGKGGQMKFSQGAPANRVGASAKQAGDFIVKVQRDRSVQLMIGSPEADYARLHREVVNEGLKAYFHAAIDAAAGKLNVRLQPHAPMQDW